MKNTNDIDAVYLEMVERFVEELQFGTVTIIIQDGRIVQVEKNEKYRLKS